VMILADILPIRAVRYSKDLTGALNLVTTPPYDVITPEQQQFFYQRHPHNIIRLELPKAFPTDNEVDNRYTRAAATYKAWLDAGVLVRDTDPSVYIYRQQFSIGDNQHTRTGIVCGVRALPYAKGDVLPHEETLPKAKTDRLMLLRSCQANFSSIFGLFNDPDGRISKMIGDKCATAPPAVSFTTEQDGICHQLWPVTEQDWITSLQQAFLSLTIYIADGHHRYETAVQYAAEMGEKGLHGYDITMMTLVALQDPGLLVLPTHRLVHNLPHFQPEFLLTKISDHFIIREVQLPSQPCRDVALDRVLTDMQAAENPTLAMYAGSSTLHLLSLKPGVQVADFCPPSRSKAWTDLDVTLLHTMILEMHLGIGTTQRANETNLTYTRDTGLALARVDDNTAQLAFFLNPTKVSQVIDVSSAGDKMPQKSTYFYPKLVTGLTINPLG